MAKVPAIEALLKDGLLLKGDDERLTIKRLPFGLPALDKAIGGGLPLGRVTLLYGSESTGKTLLCQYAAAAVQRREENNMVLFVDPERSFDASWWRASGVDTDKLFVSVPPTGEAAVDVMRAMLSAKDHGLGMIILDSIAALTPSFEADLSNDASQSSIGLQARLIGKMFRQVIPLLGDVALVVTNQMRETIGQHEDLAGLPGGRAQRHAAHLILRTRREAWLTDNKTGQRIGFDMEITPRKNKVSPLTPAIKLPFLFHGQIDLLASFLEEAIARGIIGSKVPYYVYQGKNYLGKQNLRKHFLENEEALEDLKEELGLWETESIEQSEQESTDSSSDD